MLARPPRLPETGSSDQGTDPLRNPVGKDFSSRSLETKETKFQKGSGQDCVIRVCLLHELALGLSHAFVFQPGRV